MDIRCKECFERSYQRLYRKWNINDQQISDFQPFFKEILYGDVDYSSPHAQMILQGKLKDITGIDDFYKEEKENSNQMAAEIVKSLIPKVRQSPDPFIMALRLAIAGNIMDYGAKDQFNIEDTITGVLQASFGIDHSEQLREQIKQSRNILYLGDNAGEIVFDKLFIETINHTNITYAVRGGPALNDSTLKEAREVGMDRVAKLIDSGVAAPTTLLQFSGKKFLKAYREADLIISKGQGNLEGLLDENDPRIFFLILVKCDVIGEILNTPKDSIVVCNTKYFVKNPQI